MSVPTAEPGDDAMGDSLTPGAEQALRRSGVVWVSCDGGRPRAVWHVWHDGALLLVAGGLEQELPGSRDADRAEVLVRDRGALGGLLTRWAADVERLHPGTAGWDAVVPLLAAARLNAVDPAGQADRWARDSVVLRLTPRRP
jgi:hypothetical protein